MIRVDKKSLADIQKAIVQIKQKSAKELSTELASTAAMIARDAQKTVPRDTGNLKKSIGWERVGGTSVRVFAKAPYAPYIEFGTGRGVTLRWLKDLGIPETYASQFKGKGKRDGSKVYVYARPYFFPAVRSNYDQLAKRLEKILNR